MTDGSGWDRSTDTLVIPFIFVPHGDPLPTEWLARCREPIRVPAIFVPHPPEKLEGGPDVRGGSGLAHEPGSAEASEADHTEGHGEAAGPPVSHWAKPDPVRAVQNDPVAAYARVNDYLEGLSSGHSGRVVPASASGASGQTGLAQLVADVPTSGGSTPPSLPAVAATQDPNAPVPFVDDEGRPVLNKDGQPSSGRRALTGISL